MVGPIPSVEEAVPMSDKVEFAAAFAVITAAVLVNFPRLTRMQVIRSDCFWASPSRLYRA